MRLSAPLLLALVALTALYVVFGESGPRSGRRAVGHAEEVPTGAVPRDDLGAVIPSDPADDLPGVEPGAPAPVILPEEVGEREIHLLELYGQRSDEQLRSEREVLRRRLEAELAVALEEAFDRPPDAESERAERTASGAPLLSGTRLEVDPVSMQPTERSVILAVDEHPHLYELRDTIEWLDDRIDG